MTATCEPLADERSIATADLCNASAVATGPDAPYVGVSTSARGQTRREATARAVVHWKVWLDRDGGISGVTGRAKRLGLDALRHRGGAVRHIAVEAADDRRRGLLRRAEQF